MTHSLKCPNGCEPEFRFIRVLAEAYEVRASDGTSVYLEDTPYAEDCDETYIECAFCNTRLDDEQSDLDPVFGGGDEDGSD